MTSVYIFLSKFLKKYKKNYIKITETSLGKMGEGVAIGSGSALGCGSEIGSGSALGCGSEIGSGSSIRLVRRGSGSDKGIGSDISAFTTFTNINLNSLSSLQIYKLYILFYTSSQSVEQPLTTVYIYRTNEKISKLQKKMSEIFFFPNI